MLGAAAVGSALCLSALGGSLVSLAATSTGYQVLVADGSSGTIYVNDPTAQTLTQVPPPVSGGIQSLTISPDGTAVYVAFKDGDIGTLAVPSDVYLGTPVDLGSTSAPLAMAITPNGQDLYVGESGSGQVVELLTNDGVLAGPAVGSPIATGPVTNLAISPDGSSVFFDGGSQGSSVAVIATATNTLTGTGIPVAAPGVMAISGVGTQLFVLSTPSSGPAVVVIDPATDTVEGSPITLPPGAEPAGLALSPDGGELYVTDASGQQLVSIDTATDTLNSSTVAMPQGISPHDVAVTPDGTTVYVDGTSAGGTSELVAVDLATGVTGAPVVLLGVAQPAGLAIIPVAATTPTPPTPTPTPTPTCNPIGIGPVIVGPNLSTTVTSPPAAASGSGGTPAPGSTSTGSPASDGSSTNAQPVPAISRTGDLAEPAISPEPNISPSASTTPVICFGAPVMPGAIHAEAALASGAAATASGSMYLRLALVILVLAGGAALAVMRFGTTLPRLRNWRIG